MLVHQMQTCFILSWKIYTAHGSFKAADTCSSADSRDGTTPEHYTNVPSDYIFVTPEREATDHRSKDVDRHLRIISTQTEHIEEAQ